jgi:hypothetical protein
MCATTATWIALCSLNRRKEDPMATHHPYSFSDPAEPTVARRRSFQMSDERGRVAAGDSEAPATARDWELEREESRAPLLIAGVTSAVILGGLLVALGVAAGEPQLSATVETETIPRQAAQLEMIDAAALDRARMVTLGANMPSAVTPPAPVEVEATGDETSVEAPSPAPMSVAPTAEPPSTAPMSSDSEPTRALEPNEPIMTPAPAATTPSVTLDRDNPYTSEDETMTDDPAAKPSSPRSTTTADTSDNPY